MKLKSALNLLFLVLFTFSVTAQTVHYTRTGSKYHSAGCQYLRKSDYTCTLKEALGMGLTPCSKCGPPTKVVEEKVKEQPKPVKKTPSKSKKTSYYYPSRNYYNGNWI